MLRITLQLRRLTFEALLCGAHPELPPPSRLTDVCDAAKQQFTAECSSSAPLPTAVAAGTVASLLTHHKLRDAAGLLSAHPRQQQVLHGVREYVGRYPDAFSLEVLRGMSEKVRCVGPEAVTTFLQAAAHQFFCEAAPEAANSAEQAAWHAKREDLRVLVLRHIRFHPSCASALLRPLCVLSEGSPAEREDVMGVMRLAMQQQTIDPADFGYVLEVLWRAGEALRVAAMWSWAQHTSACWDVRAASTAVMAFAALGQLEEAVRCLQQLAEAGHGVSMAAQLSFLRFLSDRTPPLPQYATQLVRHWYSTDEELWTGDAQAVGIELMRLRCRCGLHDRVVELLEAAGRTIGHTPAEWQRFLGQPPVAALGRRYAARIVESELLQKCFLDTLLHTPSLLDDRPELLGLLLSLGMAAQRLPEVYGVIAQMPTVSVDTFTKAMNFLAGGSAVRTAQAAELLACMEEVAVRTSHTVPPELKVWLQLATQM